MPRPGYSAWIASGEYGKRQRDIYEYISELLMGEQCKETYSLMELRLLSEASGASAPTFYRVLARMEQDGMVERIKDEKTCRVTIRNLLR
jgi:DNA-binding MarR family transcriptional regulator